MAEPELIHQERKILNAFRWSNLLRSKTEEDAEARHQNDLVRAEESLKQTILSADDLLNNANKSVEDARRILATAKVEYFVEQIKPFQHTSNIDSDNKNELSQSSSIATDATNKLQEGINSLLKGRRQAAVRRRFLIGAGAIAFVILAIAGFFAFQAWQTEQIYQSAITALNLGQWANARAQLDTLDRRQYNYKDAQTLRAESYYRAAIAAMDKGQWEEARVQLQQLEQYRANYKDATTLLRESFYRPATQAIELGEWEKARSALKGLMPIDGTYKDAQTLLRETYYRPAKLAFQSGKWEEAQQILDQLISVDSNYKDTQMLLRESYYLAGKMAFAEGQWESAVVMLKKLLSLDKSYKDAQNLLLESYYQAAAAALDSGQWETARTDLQELLSRQSDYKDAGVLLRESYYRPASADLKDGKFDSARTEISALLNLDSTYRDAKDLWWKTFGLAPGSCIDLPRISQENDVPSTIWDDCATVLSPDAVVQRFFELFSNDQTALLDPMMSSQGHKNADSYCGGTVVNCLSRNYAGGGYSLDSVKVLELQQLHTARVRLATKKDSTKYCQSYDLDWIDGKGWQITFFDVPVSCS